MPPHAITMEAFQLRGATYDARLTLTQHLSELRAWRLASPALYQASIALLRLDAPRDTRPEPLSG